MEARLFEVTLITGLNIDGLAELLRKVLAGKTINAKVTPYRGKFEVIEGLHLSEGAEGGGIHTRSCDNRNHMTNSHHLGLVFQTHALSFETNDDFVVEWLSEGCVRMTNQREPRVEKPIAEVVLTVAA